MILKHTKERHEKYNRKVLILRLVNKKKEKIHFFMFDVCDPDCAPQRMTKFDVKRMTGQVVVM